MDKNKSTQKRRNFLKTFGLASVPLIFPSTVLSNPISKKNQSTIPMINFANHGIKFSPEEYAKELIEINKKEPISPDSYHGGGATKQLEETFAKITGKEKAIFMPTGTMANQLVLKVLNGHNTKAIVPENSHIFRDEADAAQSVHNLRLIPVGKDKPFFSKQDLIDTIEYYDNGEVFRSGLGTIAIECPVRRADGAAMPIDTIRDISNYCRDKGFKLHLDGARIHLASAFTGVSIAEYSSYFDTVYISLYKYLNASHGAILCGSAEVIDQMSHLIKIHGGTTYQSWGATAMALYYLNGIDDRLKKVVATAKSLMDELNKINGIEIFPIENGSNVFKLKVSSDIDVRSFVYTMYRDHNIKLRLPESDGLINLAINESLMLRKPEDIIKAWKKSILA